MNKEKKQGFLRKHSLLVVTLAPLLAIIIGSLLNIWYNQMNIYQPLMEAGLLGRFHATVLIYNSVVFSVLLYIWFKWIFFLRRVRDKLRAGADVSDDELKRAQAKTINIPWVIALLCSIGWLGCIPAFICSLNFATDSLDSQISIHLVISFLISGAISGTQAFFIAEICCLQYLYPEFFDRGQHVQAAGGIAGSLRVKWLIWVVSTVVCPVCAELLLFFAPDQSEDAGQFAVAVALIFIAFGLLSAWLLARLIIRPIHHLRSAAKKVGEGDFEAHVDLQRSDDFGLLIAEFNSMVSGLKEKDHVQTMFGRHVGQRAARAILESPAGLSGTNREITAMFVDVRNFTSISESRSPEEVVELLNVFFQNMVEIVEDCGGMVNKFLGDGFMALFGAIESEDSAGRAHADAAVECAIRMAERLKEVNKRVSLPFDFAIGVGIHTGEAVVGSIGSQQRLEYTAIGDTVNVASRIEGLTKRLEKTILFSAATESKLTSAYSVTGPFEATVRGKQDAIVVYGLE